MEKVINTYIFLEEIENFIKKIIQDNRHNKYNYRILRDTEWKQTYLLNIENQNFIVQIRKKVGFYEHVVEVLEIWNKKKCNVCQLLYWEEDINYIAYVFPYISGDSAKNIILNSNSDGKDKILFKIGNNVRKLCEESTSGFGSFNKLFTGEFNTWDAYLKDIIKKNNQKLNKVCNSEAVKRLNELIENNKEKLNDIEPKLLYVDVNLGNMIVENSNITIIDYDYLISGDPLWILALFEVLYDKKTINKYFKKGFLKANEKFDNTIFNLYKIVNLIQLVGNKNIDINEKNRRVKLLEDLMKQLRLKL